MPREASLPITKTNDNRWRVSIAPKYTASGKRKRMLFDSKREASDFIAKLKTTRVAIDAHARVDQGDLAEITKAKEVMIKASVPWPGMVKLAEFWTLHKAGASKSIKDVFETYWKEKAEFRRPEYKRDIKLVLGRMAEALARVSC